MVVDEFNGKILGRDMELHELVLALGDAALRFLPDLDLVVEYESMHKERFTLSALHRSSPGWEVAR